jgi:hypothetical protein
MLLSWIHCTETALQERYDITEMVKFLFGFGFINNEQSR